MALPSNVGYGTIQGKFLRAVADSPDDVDRNPEGEPISGLTVTFTADLANRTVTNRTAEPPVTILLEAIRANTNTDGVLIGPDGAPGIVLVASTDPDLNPTDWTWRVTIEGPTYQRVQFSFALDAGSTVDLSTVIPLPARPGDEIRQWLLAVNQTRDAVLEGRAVLAQTEAQRALAETARQEALGASADAGTSAFNAGMSAATALGHANTASTQAGVATTQAGISTTQAGIAIAAAAAVPALSTFTAAVADAMPDMGSPIGAALGAQIDAAVSALVAGAPGALNTLDKLAAAVGDDANFATTVLNALAGKLSSSALDAASAALVSGGTGALAAALSTATGAQIDAAVSALVAGAPGALNTLDKLAAAVGDDANFATTVLNALAGKLSSSALDAASAALVSGGTGALAAALTTTTAAYALPQAAPFLAKLEHNAENAALLVMGDSTGADPTTETRWVRTVVNGLAARYPTHTVTLYNWDSATDVLGSAVTIQTGTGPRTLTVHNISDSGAAAFTFLSDFTNRTPGTPDLVLLSLGLNESIVSFTANYRALVQKVRAKFPMAGLALVGQNPKLPAAADANDQLILRHRIERLAAREGLGFLDAATVFTSTPNWQTTLMLGGGDTTHPNQAGYTAWGQFILSRLVHSPRALADTPKASGDRIYLPATVFYPSTGTPVLASIADGLVGYAFDALTRETVTLPLFCPPESWSKFNVYLYWTSGNPGGSIGAVQWELNTFPGIPDRTAYPSARGAATIVGIIRTSETVPSTGESGYVRRLDWTAGTANEFTGRGPLILTVSRRGDNTGNDTLGIDAVFMGLEFVRVE